MDLIPLGYFLEECFLKVCLNRRDGCKCSSKFQCSSGHQFVFKKPVTVSIILKSLPSHLVTQKV